MFCSLVSFDFLFVFQETIRVRILFQSQVLAAGALCSKYRKKNSVWISPSKAGFYRTVHLRHTLSFEEMLHIYLKFHGCNDAWIVGSYVLRTLCIFYIKSPKVSGAELELVHGMNRDMYVSDGGYKRGQRNEKHTLFISTQPCMTLLIYKYAAMFIVEQLWQFHIFQSCLLSAVTSS